MSTYPPIPVTPVQVKPLWCPACHRWATQCGNAQTHSGQWVIERGQHSRPIARLIFWLLVSPVLLVVLVIALVVVL